MSSPEIMAFAQNMHPIFGATSVADLMYVGKTIATEAYRPFETYSVIALIYFTLSVPIARLVHVVERRQDAAVQR